MRLAEHVNRSFAFNKPRKQGKRPLGIPTNSRERAAYYQQINAPFVARAGELVVRSGKSTTQIASEIGIHISVVSRSLRGVMSISPRFVEDLKDPLGLSWAESVELHLLNRHLPPSITLTPEQSDIVSQLMALPVEEARDLVAKAVAMSIGLAIPESPKLVIARIR